MKVAYYPGCTLKTTAKNFEDSAIAVAKALGIDFKELDRWYCCGAVYSIASDNLMNKISAIRNLIRAQEAGYQKFIPLCSMCYNVIKQGNLMVKEDKENLNKINEFMDREEDYKGNVEVVHFLQFIRDEIGFEKIKELVKNKLNLKVAPYYGCLLLRPEEIKIDDMEEPTIMNDLLESIGIESINTPYKGECCGAYHTVDNVDLIVERTYTIINSARIRGADAIVVSCPLCDFNLDQRQQNVIEKYKGFKPMPVFYFTQLLALALGLDENVCRFDLHFVDPKYLINGKTEKGDEK